MKWNVDRAPLEFAGVVAAVLLVNDWIGYHNTRRLDDDDRMVAHTFHVLDVTESQLGNLRDAETGGRGFMLTREPVTRAGRIVSTCWPT